MTEQDKQVKNVTKLQMKQRTDTGLKKKEYEDSDEEKKTKAGATFDPKNFRGNTDLYKHMTDFQLSMMQEYSPMKSPSLNLKKKKKTTYVDDYGVTLPEAAIERNRKGDSEAVSEASDADA